MPFKSRLNFRPVTAKGALVGFRIRTSTRSCCSNSVSLCGTMSTRTTSGGSVACPPGAQPAADSASMKSRGQIPAFFFFILFLRPFENRKCFRSVFFNERFFSPFFWSPPGIVLGPASGLPALIASRHDAMVESFPGGRLDNGKHNTNWGLLLVTVLFP